MQANGKKGESKVLGCREVQQAQHWLLDSSPAFQGATYCHTWLSLNIKGVGGSSWTNVCRDPP